jgi:Metallo-beta-lactamase superfamily
LIITHFHADHVDGLVGVLQHRHVGQLWVSPLAPSGPLAAVVRQQAAAHGIPVNAPLSGTRASVGEAEVQVLGPVDHVAADQDESSRQNDSSLVIMVTVASLRLLLTGDVEPPGQQAIVNSGADLHADVLKIPHHGSAPPRARKPRGLGRWRRPRRPHRAAPFGSMYQPYRRIGSVNASSRQAICASVRILLYVVIEFGHASSGTVSVTSANADHGTRPVLP